MDALAKYIDSVCPLSPDSYQELRNCFKPAHLSKYDFFVRQGQYAKQIGFLNKGVIRAFFVNQSGKEYTKQFFMPLSITGAYTSLIKKEPNQVAQQALTDCEILVANYSEIEILFDSFHDMERLGRNIAERFFLEKEQKEIEMALLDGAERYRILQTRFPGIETMVPQYHIASYLGVSPTQLSRIRAKIK